MKAVRAPERLKAAVADAVEHDATADDAARTVAIPDLNGSSDQTAHVIESAFAPNADAGAQSARATSAKQGRPRRRADAPRPRAAGAARTASRTTVRFVAALIAAALVIGAAVAVALETGFSPFEPVEPTAPTTGTAQEPFDATEAPAPSDSESRSDSAAAEPAAANFFQIVVPERDGRATAIGADAGYIETEPASDSTPDLPLYASYAPGGELFGLGSEMSGSFAIMIPQQATNLDTITVEIEGDDVRLMGGNGFDEYPLGTDHMVTREEDLQPWIESQFSLANIEVPDNADLEAYRLFIDVNVTIDTPDSVWEAWDHYKIHDEGLTGNALFANYPTWENEYAMRYVSAFSDTLANSRITITATFDDGSSQAGTYVLAYADDFVERYVAYRESVSAYNDTVKRLRDEGRAAEADSLSAPEMPALLSFTHVG